jgi:hypothetical protein
MALLLIKNSINFNKKEFKMSLNLVLILYSLIFIGFGIYDFLYFEGYLRYIILFLDIFFGFLIISSSIESYIKNELVSKKKK